MDDEVGERYCVLSLSIRGLLGLSPRADSVALAGTVIAGLLLASLSRSESMLAVDVVEDGGDFAIDSDDNVLVPGAHRYT